MGPPEENERQAPVKTLPSATSFAGGNNHAHYLCISYFFHAKKKKPQHEPADVSNC